MFYVKTQVLRLPGSVQACAELQYSQEPPCRITLDSDPHTSEMAIRIYDQDPSGQDVRICTYRRHITISR
ncbi:hypothetical protein RRF57_008992 [Xylaria bambusicola]|uniref:Uncharacterized protein n=1 Tax=Xylaria bambusicola TaxID=326684 RepID=A0AAN7ZBQ4_9PEZI